MRPRRDLLRRQLGRRAGPDVPLTATLRQRSPSSCRSLGRLVPLIHPLWPPPGHQSATCTCAPGLPPHGHQSATCMTEVRSLPVPLPAASPTAGGGMGKGRERPARDYSNRAGASVLPAPASDREPAPPQTRTGPVRHQAATTRTSSHSASAGELQRYQAAEQCQQHRAA